MHSDIGQPVNIIYLDFHQSFDTVSTLGKLHSWGIVLGATRNGFIPSVPAHVTCTCLCQVLSGVASLSTSMVAGKA